MIESVVPPFKVKSRRSLRGRDKEDEREKEEGTRRGSILGNRVSKTVKKVLFPHKTRLHSRIDHFGKKTSQRLPLGKTAI